MLYKYTSLSLSFVVHGGGGTRVWHSIDLVYQLLALTLTENSKLELKMEIGNWKLRFETSQFENSKFKDTELENSKFEN